MRTAAIGALAVMAVSGCKGATKSNVDAGTTKASTSAEQATPKAPDAAPPAPRCPATADKPVRSGGVVWDWDKFKSQCAETLEPIAVNSDLNSGTNIVSLLFVTNTVEDGKAPPEQYMFEMGFPTKGFDHAGVDVQLMAQCQKTVLLVDDTKRIEAAVKTEFDPQTDTIQVMGLLSGDDMRTIASAKKFEGQVCDSYNFSIGDHQRALIADFYQQRSNPPTGGK